MRADRTRTASNRYVETSEFHRRELVVRQGGVSPVRAVIARNLRLQASLLRPQKR